MSRNEDQRTKACGPGAHPDRIFLRDHIRHLDIGAFQAERDQLQRVRFNITVELAQMHDGDSGGGVDDDVDGVLSYDAITEAIDRALDRERLNLLETLAVRIADDILRNPLAAQVHLCLEKLDRGPGVLGVEMTRRRGADQTPAQAVEPHSASPVVVYLGRDVVTDPAALSDLLGPFLASSSPHILCPFGAPVFTSGSIPSEISAEAQLRIALLELEQNAWKLAGREARCTVVSSRTELEWSMKNKVLSVWAPSKLVLDATDPPDVSGARLDPKVLVAWFAKTLGACDVITLGDVASPLGRVVAGAGHLPDQNSVSE